MITGTSHNDGPPSRQKADRGWGVGTLTRDAAHARQAFRDHVRQRHRERAGKRYYLCVECNEYHGAPE